jgi:hypothetical protein
MTDRQLAAMQGVNASLAAMRLIELNYNKISIL